MAQLNAALPQLSDLKRPAVIDSRRRIRRCLPCFRFLARPDGLVTAGLAKGLRDACGILRILSCARAMPSVFPSAASYRPLCNAVLRGIRCC